MTVDAYPAYDSYKDSGVDWIGGIPKSWDHVANKRLFRLRKTQVGKRSSEYDLLSLTLRGIIKRDMDNPEGKFPAEFDTYQEVQPGDFVFCHFDVEETPRTVGLSTFDGMITGAYTVYELKAEADASFLFYFYLNADTDKKLRGLYKGLRNTIPKESFGAFKTPLPPLSEQRGIAAFLDEKCAKVDEAVRIKEEQIALLRERRQILIQQAVIRGLKPDAHMRDSGVDWIGQIPAHWEVVPLKRLFRERNDRSTTGTETLLSLRMNEGLVPHDDVSDKPIGADALKDYKKVFAGQLVMNRMRASIGIFGIVTFSGIVSPDYAIFDIAPRASGDFFLQLFKTGVMGEQFRNASRGLGTGSSGFMRLYTDDFGAISVALPPRTEQAAIVSHINNFSEKIGDAIQLKENQIVALKEFKSSLIDAAVTGKIKVI